MLIKLHPEDEVIIDRLQELLFLSPCEMTAKEVDENYRLHSQLAGLMAARLTIARTYKEISDNAVKGEEHA